MLADEILISHFLSFIINNNTKKSSSLPAMRAQQKCVCLCVYVYGVRKMWMCDDFGCRV